MNKHDIRKAAQRLVMNNLFSEWDDSKSFPKILEAIKDQNLDTAYPWEPMEDIDPQVLANIVCDLTGGIVYLVDLILQDRLESKKLAEV